ncbi:MAG: flagellar export chaperone FliS [Candidatus Lambdaproteobacteria bacterium RIFOXYD1_FULL_56_27]|nr:MAG: flagellar export chaperone FliS [Candidatus Lambdaproteobacteria bacterium RIFOXYC1_FULL_56_13]OGH09000.1 MAG: flagellar export chaperone FliS [Candidatus Lambdaproteobacteria bacterium RIFOXYD1_FULL_56_27]
MAYGKPFQAYQQTSVQTSSQKQLIVMLYDGMHRFMSQAIGAIEAGEVEAAHQNLHRTGKILLELLATLREDKGGEVAQNLKKLYVYCYEQIVIANLKKDAELVREIQKVIGNLREGWKELYAASQKPQSNTVSREIRVTG